MQVHKYIATGDVPKSIALPTVIGWCCWWISSSIDSVNSRVFILLFVLKAEVQIGIKSK